ncbi:methyl-accepting chemotaxis protein [Propionivibrio soli]|uniref:methyl-accepting chemotaxis protein n=1 Tax=Propionivibrio soli TaxID=2976531 RepID=UPI0021E72918|nr:methyl-accepting chemotaxis protein [Propionivibrio soli]
MNRITIASRILLMIGASVLALLWVGIVGLTVAEREAHGIRAINDESLAGIQKLSKVQKDVLMLRGAIYAHVLNTDAFAFLTFDKRIDDTSKQLIQSLKEYEDSITKDDDKKLLAEEKAKVMAFIDLVVKDIFPKSKSNQKADAKAVLEDRGSTLGDSALAALDAHMAANEKRAAEIAEEAFAAAANGRVSSITVIISGVVAIALLGLFLRANIKSSLNQIRSMVAKVESDLDFTVRVKVTKQDEIGETTAGLNRLLDKLQSNLGSIAEGAKSVASASDQLAVSSGHVAKASQQQSEAAAAMAATVEEITVSINHVADQAQEANRISKESGQLASTGELIIGQAATGIQEIASTVHEAAGLIHGLEQQSQQISQVVSVIKDVADQTNLLALNAAIEAARAGEQGRGFAVVADEVRKLAERTALSTQQITQTIESMRSKAGDAVNGMQLVVDKVAVGVERAQEANNAISKIGEGSRRAVSMVEEIAEAIREQGSATNNIATQVERIAQMSEESNAAAEASASSAGELDRLANDMQRVVGAYRL